MADLDFPTSPSDGDTYAGYVYNATKGVWQWQTVNPSLVSLTDTDISSPSSGEVLEYDGTNWVNAAKTVGGLVAVKSALFTGVQTASVAGGGNVAVTDLSITHALSDASNKLIISAFFGAAAQTFGRGNVGIAVDNGSGLLAVGDAAGLRTPVTAGGLTTFDDKTNVVTMPATTFVHAPNTTSSLTYTVQAINIINSPQTLYINRTESDTDTETNPRAVSSLVIQEVAV